MIFYFLLQTASNTAQGPYQGLLPDVVPPEQRGEASGYYGVANLVGILAGTVGRDSCSTSTAAARDRQHLPPCSR